MTFEFVYTKNKLDFKRYIKAADVGNSSVISYHDIITKLSKTDNHQPSPDVVGSFLRKKIIKSLNDSYKNDPENEKNVKHVFYAIKDLDIDVFENIESIIERNWDHEDIDFILTIVENKKFVYEPVSFAERLFVKINVHNFNDKTSSV